MCVAVHNQQTADPRDGIWSLVRHNKQTLRASKERERASQCQKQRCVCHPLLILQYLFYLDSSRLYVLLQVCLVLVVYHQQAVNTVCIRLHSAAAAFGRLAQAHQREWSRKGRERGREREREREKASSYSSLSVCKQQRV